MMMVPEPLRQIFQMERAEVERELAPYFYQYFKYYFDSPARLEQYARFCKHIFDVSETKDSKVLDIGCGFGLIAIHLATIGARMVSAVDANEEKFAILQKILARFNPPLANIEARFGDALDLDYKDGYFDTIIANEVISHMRDTDIFIREMNRVLRPGGVLYLKDGNNALDIVGRYRRRKFWRGREYGPVDEASIRGTEKAVPWQMVRREIIQAAYPQLEAPTLDLLARETRGMYGNEIGKAVEGYLREGQVLNKPAFQFRDPVTGEYNEAEFNPYLLQKKLERSGFSAGIIRPYSPRRPLLPAKGILLNLAIDTIAVFHPLSLIIAPHFEIIARKK
ncbi:MAG: methyltransferase domain-containing protein [Chloroflexi bacterium]|nr:methyltransferase domain-containing protein [Chloroflexota bacterium]